MKSMQNLWNHSHSLRLSLSNLTVEDKACGPTNTCHRSSRLFAKTVGIRVMDNITYVSIKPITLPLNRFTTSEDLAILLILNTKIWVCKWHLTSSILNNRLCTKLLTHIKFSFKPMLVASKILFLPIQFILLSLVSWASPIQDDTVKRPCVVEKTMKLR